MHRPRNGRGRVLQPIDYVGEELLEPGDHAHRLVLDPGSGGLSLSLVEE